MGELPRLVQFLSVALVFALVWSGLAQDVPPQRPVSVPPGTEVEIELQETISSETLHVGQAVPFKLLCGLERDGVTLLPAGSPFLGTVTSANARGHWGKAGAFDLKLEPLIMPDGTLLRLDFHHPAKLNARGEKTGETAETVIQMTYYFPLLPAALIASSRRGKPFTIRAGERYLVYAMGTSAATTEPKQP